MSNSSVHPLLQYVYEQARVHTTHSHVYKLYVRSTRTSITYISAFIRDGDIGRISGNCPLINLRLGPEDGPCLRPPIFRKSKFQSLSAMQCRGPRVADPFALLRGGSGGPVCPYSVYTEPRILCGGSGGP